MATATRMFFAGVGTTFAILAIGFGGGLMLAKTVLHDTPPSQMRASLEKSSPVRLILPQSAEQAPPAHPTPAIPSEPSPQLELAPTVQLQPAPTVQPVAQKPLERADTKRAEREERVRKRRYAEAKARRIARAKEQLEQPQRAPEPGLMAFGMEQPRSVGFFGN